MVLRLSGYVDLSMAEAEALSVAAEVPHLPWMVPPGQVDPFGDRVSRGRESLLARGLARRVNEGYEVDADVAAALDICARSGRVLGVFIVGPTGGGVGVVGNWLCIGADSAVLVSAIPESGVFRIRSFPPLGALHVVRKLSGLHLHLLPSEHTLTITRQQVQELEALLAEHGRGPLDPVLLASAGMNTQTVEQVLGGLSRAVVVTSVRGTAEGLSSRNYSWFMTGSDRLLRLRVSETGLLELVPVPGTDVGDTLAEVLGCTVAG
jgi:hypothetical protein